jgi:hypothetical protein
MTESGFAYAGIPLSCLLNITLKKRVRTKIAWSVLEHYLHPLLEDGALKTW